VRPGSVVTCWGGGAGPIISWRVSVIRAPGCGLRSSKTCPALGAKRELSHLGFPALRMTLKRAKAESGLTFGSPPSLFPPAGASRRTHRCRRALDSASSSQASPRGGSSGNCPRRRRPRRISCPGMRTPKPSRVRGVPERLVATGSVGPASGRTLARRRSTTVPQFPANLWPPGKVYPSARTC